MNRNFRKPLPFSLQYLNDAQKAFKDFMWLAQLAISPRSKDLDEYGKTYLICGLERAIKIYLYRYRLDDGNMGRFIDSDDGVKLVERIIQWLDEDGQRAQQENREEGQLYHLRVEYISSIIGSLYDTSK